MLSFNNPSLAYLRIKNGSSMIIYMCVCVDVCAHFVVVFMILAYVDKPHLTFGKFTVLFLVAAILFLTWPG